MSSTINSNTITTDQQQQQPHLQTRQPHIILGITGSVAAIKGPELALLLARTLRAKVIVVLTNGGTNFWYKANEYKNGLKWKEYCDFMNRSNPHSCNNRCENDTYVLSNGNINDNGCKEKSVFSMLLEMEQQQKRTNGDYSDNGDDQVCEGDIAICRKCNKTHQLPLIQKRHYNQYIYHYFFMNSTDAQDEWNNWNKIGDPVLHIQLRDWADMIIVAPLSAHTLAKISNGLCDDTLSCILRAWNYGHKSSSSSSSSIGKIIPKNMDASKSKPIILAPAMNTAMWDHPLTEQQLQTMKGFWCCLCNQKCCNDKHANDTICSRTFIVEPQVKMLACGDIGTGAMANVDDIVNLARQHL